MLYICAVVNITLTTCIWQMLQRNCVSLGVEPMSLALISPFAWKKQACFCFTNLRISLFSPAVVSVSIFITLKCLIWSNGGFMSIMPQETGHFELCLLTHTPWDLNSWQTKTPNQFFLYQNIIMRIIKECVTFSTTYHMQFYVLKDLRVPAYDPTYCGLKQVLHWLWFDFLFHSIFDILYFRKSI